MTNKELQEILKQYPDNIDVWLDRNGSIYIPCTMIKYLNLVKQDCIVISSKINM